MIQQLINYYLLDFSGVHAQKIANSNDVYYNEMFANPKEDENIAAEHFTRMGVGDTEDYVKVIHYILTIYQENERKTYRSEDYDFLRYQLNNVNKALKSFIAIKKNKKQKKLAFYKPFITDIVRECTYCFINTPLKFIKVKLAKIQDNEVACKIRALLIRLHELKIRFNSDFKLIILAETWNFNEFLFNE